MDSKVCQGSDGKTMAHRKKEAVFLPLPLLFSKELVSTPLPAIVRVLAVFTEKTVAGIENVGSDSL